MRTHVKTANDPPVMDRHAMTDVLNRYIDSLIAEKNRAASDLVTKRNTEMESLQRDLSGSRTSFSTGTALTASGYGLGRLASLSKRLGRLRGHKAGLLSAGLTAGGLMLKDRFFPNKARLPAGIPIQWPDPTAAQTPSPSPNIWQRLRNLVLPDQADKQAMFDSQDSRRLPLPSPLRLPPLVPKSSQ